VRNETRRSGPQRSYSFEYTLVFSYGNVSTFNFMKRREVPVMGMTSRTVMGMRPVPAPTLMLAAPVQLGLAGNFSAMVVQPVSSLPAWIM
jgi:hypothetical protein